MTPLPAPARLPRGHGLGRLVVGVLLALVVVEGLLLALGLLVTRVLARGPLGRDERRFEGFVVAHRTHDLDVLTRTGTLLGGTTTVVVLTAVACALLAGLGHRPRVPVFLALAVAGETLLFLLATLVLRRVRPPVPHLDPAPPTSSFPSGHTAATVALWGGLALALARGAPRSRPRRPALVAAVVLPLLVLACRLYRGMHWPTDVAASLVFATVWLGLLGAVLLPERVRT